MKRPSPPRLSMKLALKIVGVLVLLFVLFAGGSYTWASLTTSRTFDRDIAVHDVDFPIPFPLDSAEIAQLGLSPEQADSAATERAVERGRHLIDSRYGCTACHGGDLSGGVMIDVAPMGTILGPNLTPGAGSRTEGFRAADWDRIVRHGVLSTGKPAVMPSQDFMAMSDAELSDIATFILTRPPVDNEVPRPTFGPVGKFLVATGTLPVSADLIGGHDAPHLVEPPAADVSVEFGKHLAGVCVGCHQQDLGGGPIPGGDPSWAPALNLTPNADGSPRWTLDEFVTIMREGRRTDGSALLPPMSEVVPYTDNMTDIELEAIYTYLTSVASVANRS